MFRAKSEPELLDKICMDMIYRDQNKLIPWFILYHYARSKHDSLILSELLYQRIRKRIHKSLEDLEHPFKENITRKGLTSDDLQVTYPKGIEIVLKTVKGMIE